MSRFVILRHFYPESAQQAVVEIPFEDHFDLMLEMPLPEHSSQRTKGDERSLWTYRIKELPLLESQPVTQLPNHRQRYLDYEGPLTDNRGAVLRIAEGNLNWVLTTPEQRVAILNFTRGIDQAISSGTQHSTSPDRYPKIRATILREVLPGSETDGVNYRLEIERETLGPQAGGHGP